jgi:Protein of unknown function (DUF3617)
VSELYRLAWQHYFAVCMTVGALVATSRLLEPSRRRRERGAHLAGHVGLALRWAAGVSAACVGGALVAGALLVARESAASARWPAAAARVLVVDSIALGHSDFGVRNRYAYHIDGRDHANDRIWMDQLGNRFRTTDPGAWIRRLRPGTVVLAYYEIGAGRITREPRAGECPPAVSAPSARACSLYQAPACRENAHPSPTMGVFMRLITCLAGLSLCAGVTVSLADDLPHLKPGLWLISSGSSHSHRPRTSKLCVDHSTLGLMVSAGATMEHANCSRNERHFTGATMISDSVCRIGESESTTHAVVTYHGDTAYDIETHAHYAPPFFGRSDSTSHQSARWIGACPADMKPGDMLTPEGMKMNLGKVAGLAH